MCACLYPLCCTYIMPKWTNEEKKRAVHATERFIHTHAHTYTNRKVLCTSEHIAQNFKIPLKEQLHFVRHHVCSCVYYRVKRQEEVNAFRWGYAIMPSAMCAGVWMWKGTHKWLNAIEVVFAYACSCHTCLRLLVWMRNAKIHLHPHTFQGAWLFWPDAGPTT